MTTIPFLGEYISLKTKQKSNFKEKIKMKKTVKRVTTAIIATVMCMSATTAAFAASTTDTPVVDENCSGIHSYNSDNIDSCKGVNSTQIHTYS